jgi:putative peptidoglycan lipid II flippase
VNAALLLGVLMKRGHWGSDAGLTRRTPPLIVASAVMAGAIWAAVAYLAPYLASASPIHTQAVTLAVIIAGAMLIYFAAAFGLGGADIGMIRRNIRQRGGAQPPTDPE